MIFYIKPIGKPRMTRRDSWKKRPCVIRYYEYKDFLKEKALENKFVLPDILSCTFVIPMPPSWSKKKKSQMEGSPHKQRPDLDNILKGLQDCLATEDSYIWKYKECNKIWGYEGMIIVN